MNSQTTKITIKHIFSSQFIAKTIAVALLYSTVSLFMIGSQQITSLFSTSLPLLQKIYLTSISLPHYFMQLEDWMKVTHILIALLFALNVLIVSEKIFIKKAGSSKLNLGVGIISLSAAGCTACGISLLSLLGIGSALAVLPFGGSEIMLVVLLILVVTFLYNIHSYTKSCKIK